MSQSLFLQQLPALKKLLATAPDMEDYKAYNYFVKCDISGIQDFIFYVKSKGAAKTLKARSFYIQAICEVVLELFNDTFKEENVQLLYNGGGNFYLFLNIQNVANFDTTFKNLQATIQAYLKKEELYIILSYVKLSPNGFTSDGHFGEVWRTLNKNTNLQKLVKFQNFADGFATYTINSKQSKWQRFSKQLTESKGFTITKKNNELDDIQHNENYVSRDDMYLLSKQLHLIEKNSPAPISKKAWEFSEKVVNQLPIWTSELITKHDAYIKNFNAQFNDLPKKERLASQISPDDIIEFDCLADFAKMRTGTAKLGILKMDIDNLGNLFSSTTTIKNTHQLSLAMFWFFETFVKTLLQAHFTYTNVKKDPTGDLQITKNKEKFHDNIYTVFAGGDDCFFVGAWDAILLFCQQLRNAFKEFQNYLLSIPGLGEALKKGIKVEEKQITLSAGIILVDAHFPVVRFAQLVEDALDAAKDTTIPTLDEKGNPVSYKKPKNRICIFNEVLRWEGFDTALDTALHLQKLINEKEEPRGILNRIKLSAIGYENLQTRLLNGESISAPKVWRLQYFIRNTKNRDDMDIIIKKYTTALVDVFAKKETTNPMAFPIAARLGEFLTRK